MDCKYLSGISLVIALSVFAGCKEPLTPEPQPQQRRDMGKIIPPEGGNPRNPFLNFRKRSFPRWEDSRIQRRDSGSGTIYRLLSLRFCQFLVRQQDSHTRGAAKAGVQVK